MEKYITLTPIFSALLGGSVMSFVQFLITRHDEKKRQLIPVDKFDKLVLLTLAQVQARLTLNGDVFLHRGSITARERAMYYDIYIRYRALGGNGYAEATYKKVMNLPISDTGVDLRGERGYEN